MPIEMSNKWNDRNIAPQICEKYEQHAGRERDVRLIEDILADPRVTADDNVQTEQSTDTDFNKLVCNSNDPYRARWCAEP